MKGLVPGVIAALVCSASLRAHDAEHTAVSMTFARDGSFVLDVVNDPNWLLLRLESFVERDAQRPDSNPAKAGSHIRDAHIRDARLSALAPVFIDRIVLFVDGHEVRPVSAEYLAPALQAQGAPAPLAAYRLRGRVSPGARVLRWYYGMVVDPYPLGIARADGRSQQEWIVAGDAWSRGIDLTGQFVMPTRREIARRYLRLGYEQILPRGVGHVLFILGLLLLNIRVRPIAVQLSAFTLAHLVAMWLTAYGLMSVPSRWVGLMIASSVAYVAIENLMTNELKPWRGPAVVLFGAAHGAAFGQVVTALVLTRSELPVALTWFTAGVESAQLTVLALASALLFVGSTRTRSTVRSVRLSAYARGTCRRAPARHAEAPEARRR